MSSEQIAAVKSNAASAANAAILTIKAFLIFYLFAWFIMTSSHNRKITFFQAAMLVLRVLLVLLVLLGHLVGEFHLS